jgi:YD repeat-containing protein
MASWFTYVFLLAGSRVLARRVFVAIRIVLRWLAVLSVSCLFVTGLEAQTNSCIAQLQYYCGDPQIPGATFSNEGSCLAIESVASKSCPAICWDCLLGTPHTQFPINLATGDTFITESDLSIPGLGGGLSLSRTWHSQFPFAESVPTSGMFGGNWRSTYEEVIYVDPGGLVKYVRGTGGIWTLGFAGGGGSGEAGWAGWAYSMIAPANGNVSLAYNGTLSGNQAYWVLSFNTGETRIFTVHCTADCGALPTIGYLASITDRNGNTTQLTYDASNRLTTVTDPASRHLYFSYASQSSNLIVGVSSDVGISLSYAYDGQGRLATITKPDLTTVSFQYDGNSLISAVLDTNGKILESHIYDTAYRGTTSSQAGGVNALTVTYPFLVLGLP